MQHIFTLPEFKTGANRVALPVQLINRVDVTVQYNWSRIRLHFSALYLISPTLLIV